MTNYEENENGLPKLPKKLDRIISDANDRMDEDDDREVIIGNGARKLTSQQPVSVVEYFLVNKVAEWADWTFKDYSYDLTRFLEYCAYADIDDLSQLSTRDIEGFKDWRKLDGNIGLASLHGQLANVRVFIRKCESWEIIESGIADDIELPELDNSDIVSYTRISPEEAKAILNHHEKYEHAKRRHVEFAMIWELLCRLGGLRSLDLDNYDQDDEGNYYVEFQHTPDEDTPLKNGDNSVEGEGGERRVNVPDWLAEIIDDYIEEERFDVEDEYGRQPLFTTEHGRVSESTIRRDLYRVTQPCRYGQDCPYEVNTLECSSRANVDAPLSHCPSTVSPHPVRRGGICHQLKQGVRKDTICEKADVSRKVLNKHYDIRTKEEARVQRRQELKRHLEGYDSATQDLESETLATGRFSEWAAASPLVEDTLTISNRLVDRLTRDQPSPSSRLAKGLAGYAVFVTMVGINLGLMGIGFDPITMEIVFNVW